MDATPTTLDIFTSQVKAIDGLVSELDASLQEALGGIQADIALPELLDHLCTSVKEIHHRIEALGDQAHRLLTIEKHTPKTVSAEHIKGYIICFEWIERAKSFLILWRDIAFEWQKAGLYETDRRVQKSAIEQLLKDSKRTLISACNELTEQLQSRAQSMGRAGNQTEKQIYDWKLQQNPWPTYREQLKQLPSQIERIQNQYLEMSSYASVFHQIRQEIRDAINHCQDEVDLLDESSEQTIAFIQEQFQGDDPKPGRVVSKMQELEGLLQFPDHITNLSAKLEELETQLPDDKQVIVQVEEGLLQYREFGFSNQSKQWLESEIKPILFEVWEIAILSQNRKKMALVNIRNRASLLVSEQKETGRIGSGYDDIIQPLRTFIDKLEGPTQNMKDLEALVMGRMNEEFRITNVFQAEQPFLPIPLQSTIKQLRLDQNELWLRVRNWFRQRFQFLTDFSQKVADEEKLSLSERIVRYIEHRKSAANNAQYHSIFLTKGYIGDSFLVGRDGEVDRVVQVFQNWQAGYRGSVLITGKRLSGKSLFGELLTAQVFSQDTVIRLQPNTLINIDGRKEQVSFKLNEALDFVLKHTLNKKAIVWIDDFELWWEPDQLLGSNVRTLQRYIDDYANRLFFVVSMNNWLSNHLTRQLDLHKVFQASVCMDQMKVDEIREAILIRHGATHKLLVNEEGEEVQPNEFRRMTKRIFLESRGNVGDALNLWAAHTKRYSEEEVIHKVHDRFFLPNFVTAETGMLLGTLMLLKRSNEYRLRKLFGPAFKRTFSSTVQRLISVGILVRRMDGWLEINEYVSNELSALLEKEGHL